MDFNGFLSEINKGYTTYAGMKTDINATNATKPAPAPPVVTVVERQIEGSSTGNTSSFSMSKENMFITGGVIFLGIIALKVL